MLVLQHSIFYSKNDENDDFTFYLYLFHSLMQVPKRVSRDVALELKIELGRPDLFDFRRLQGFYFQLELIRITGPI